MAQQALDPPAAAAALLCRQLAAIAALPPLPQPDAATAAAAGSRSTSPYMGAAATPPQPEDALSLPHAVKLEILPLFKTTTPPAPAHAAPAAPCAPPAISGPAAATCPPAAPCCGAAAGASACSSRAASHSQASSHAAAERFCAVSILGSDEAASARPAAAAPAQPCCGPAPRQQPAEQLHHQPHAACGGADDITAGADADDADEDGRLWQYALVACPWLFKPCPSCCRTHTGREVRRPRTHAARFACLRPCALPAALQSRSTGRYCTASPLDILPQHTCTHTHLTPQPPPHPPRCS